jgi:uncharacterized protein (TIGR02118 family)
MVFRKTAFTTTNPKEPAFASFEPSIGYNKLLISPHYSHFMHKLIILIPPFSDEADFDEHWPEFITLSANIPGLRRESTSRVLANMYGEYPCTLVHELYFDSADATRQALNSPIGIQAGKTLQRITGGKVTLLLAEHLEDDPGRYAKKAQTQPKQKEGGSSKQGTTA